MPRYNPLNVRRPSFAARIRPIPLKTIPPAPVGDKGIPILSENKEKDGYELKFPGKPSEAVLALFHETKTLPPQNRWHWHHKLKFWYAKRNEATREFAQLVITLATTAKFMSEGRSAVLPNAVIVPPITPVTPVPAEEVAKAFVGEIATEHALSEDEAKGLQVLGAKLPSAEAPEVIRLPVEHEQFPKSDWAYDVQNGDTRLGYEDWVEAKMDLAAEEAVEPPEPVEVEQAGPKSWKTEVCVSGSWSGNGCRYATKAEAEEAGKELLQRWFVPTDSRAAESDDPVNYRFNMETYKSEMLPEPVAEQAPEPTPQEQAVPSNVIPVAFATPEPEQTEPAVPQGPVPDWRSRFSWSRR